MEIISHWLDFFNSAGAKYQSLTQKGEKTMERRILTNDNLEYFAKWLKQEEKSIATCEKYLRDVRRFMEYTAGEAVTKEVVARWKNDLIAQEYAVRSINSMLASVNSLFVFWGWEDCKVKNIRLQQQTFSPEEKELTSRI